MFINEKGLIMLIVLIKFVLSSVKYGNIGRECVC